MAAGFYFDAFEVRILARDLERAGPLVRERTETVIEKTGEDTVRDGQAACPVDFGYLRSTISMDPDPDGLGFEAGPTASYGGHVEFGTRAHIIEPRTAKALFWPGAAHPVRRVRHPGTSPQPYMIPAFERNIPLAVEAMGHVGEDIL